MIDVRPYRAGDVLTPGWYDMSAEHYHADPCPKPSLSASIGRLLAYRAPMHAQRAHPRLWKQPAPTPPDRNMCIGSAVHALALGKGAEVVEIPFEDYKKKDAQDARDTALGRGRIPVLTPDLETVEAMWRPMREAIVRRVGDDHLSEVVGVWEEDGIWRRIMVDAMSRDGSIWLDAKTTGVAEPAAFAKHFFNMGYDFNEVFYRDGGEVLAPQTAHGRKFFFLAQERDFPEAITAHETDPATREIAGRDVNRALDLWKRCMESNQWPAYARGPHIILAPAWRIRELEMSE